MNTDLLIDLGAIQAEIHDTVTEQADSYDFDEGVNTRDALLALIEEAKTAVSHLDTRMLTHLEAGAQQRGTRLFKRKRNIVERFRHDLICADVARWARIKATDDLGVTSITKAIDAAVGVMQNLYVSPSTKAKIGGLDAVGIDRKRVTEREDKGWKLEVEQLDERTDD